MHVTLTKQGKVEFDDYKRGLTRVRLVSATVYNTFNVMENSKYTAAKEDRVVEISKGYYSIEDLIELLGGAEVSLDESTLEVIFKGKPEGGLAKLYDDTSKLLYLRPNVLYVYLEELDTKDNYLNGKSSNLLSAIYLTNGVGAGDISIYHVNTDAFKKLATTDNLNRLNISIKDKYGNDYMGRFVLDLELD